MLRGTGRDHGYAGVRRVPEHFTFTFTLAVVAATTARHLNTLGHPLGAFHGPPAHQVLSGHPTPHPLGGGVSSPRGRLHTGLRDGRSKIRRPAAGALENGGNGERGDMRGNEGKRGEMGGNGEL